MYDRNPVWTVLAWVIGIFLVVSLLFVVIIGMTFGVKAYSRYQKRQDAKNNVQINHTRIKYFTQQKQIERINAEIRVIHAVGIRKSQDEIAATLTPLYVSFEQTEALKAIAMSGKNNSVVFVPTNPNNGLPIVPGITERVGK
jgi:hypothetical protein